MSEDAGGQSKTLVRGLSILNACSGSRSGLTLVEIAEATDLAPSTVHRLLATLEALSFLSVNSETGRWRLRHEQMRVIKIQSLNVPLVQILAAITIGVVILISTQMSARDLLSPGEFVAYITAMGMIFDPVRRLTGVL